MVCKACGREIVEDSRFCCFCGEDMGRKFCSQCGTKITTENKFCPKCGTTLEMDETTFPRTQRTRTRELDTIPLSSERETREEIFSRPERIAYDEVTAEPETEAAQDEQAFAEPESLKAPAQNTERTDVPKSAEQRALEDKWDRIFAAQQGGAAPKKTEAKPEIKHAAKQSGTGGTAGASAPSNAPKKGGAAQSGAKGGLTFLSFIIPLAGLILFIKFKTAAPLAAKTYLKTAILSVVIYMIVMAVVVIGGLAYLGILGQ